MSLLDLPPVPDTAAPVIVPGLLSGLGIVPDLPTPAITRRPVPAWITDPDAITSIALGLVEVDDDLVTRDEPTTLRQIRRRIYGWWCFYVVVYQARIAELEALVACNNPNAEA